MTGAGGVFVLDMIGKEISPGSCADECLEAWGGLVVQRRGRSRTGDTSTTMAPHRCWAVRAFRLRHWLYSG